MRTTLTIEDQLVRKLKQRALETNRSFKDVVNEALRSGLEQNGAGPASRPYQYNPIAMGQANSDLDLNKALRLAGVLEDEALASKIELRK